MIVSQETIDQMRRIEDYERERRRERELKATRYAQAVKRADDFYMSVEHTVLLRSEFYAKLRAFVLGDLEESPRQ